MIVMSDVPFPVSRERLAAWLNIQQTSRVIQDLLEARLRTSTDLSWPEFQLLFRLRIVGDHPLQMGEIAAQLLASPSGLTRIADRLEQNGLITRETPRDNRRVVRVSLTERGKDVLAQADRAVGEVLRESFAEQLSEEEVGWLRRILRKLLERNGAWSDARCEPGFEPPSGSCCI
jgi:DNA-binding MarR family transcriptional regulator